MDFLTLLHPSMALIAYICQWNKQQCYINSYVCNSNKNSAEVDIAPAFGEITTACNVGQGKNVTVRG